jgi:hypothetical protein
MWKKTGDFFLKNFKKTFGGDKKRTFLCTRFENEATFF